MMSRSIHSSLFQSQDIRVSHAEKKQRSGYRILLVDDDEDLLYISQKFIERYEGFVVDTVSSAQKGLEKLKLYSYDVIVSDFDMPELNGIDFYKLLRLEDKLTPFIIFSSKSQEEITFCHPMSDSIVFLQKQTNLKQVFKELVSIIRSVME